MTMTGNNEQQIDEQLDALDDSFWHQKEIDERQLWERHRKGLGILDKILDAMNVKRRIKNARSNSQ
jgi:hypothetical protein